MPTITARFVLRAIHQGTGNIKLGTKRASKHKSRTHTRPGKFAGCFANGTGCPKMVGNPPIVVESKKSQAAAGDRKSTRLNSSHT